MNIPRQSAWWKESVIYQIYPKSFYDSNNDGVGDIRGIIEKLPYLKTLGITVIWVSPFYRSPMADNGYDIADYFAVNPDFGSMQDVDELIARSGEMGIQVMIDLVVNHTSDEHARFQQALADPESPIATITSLNPKLTARRRITGVPFLAVARGKKSPAKRCTTFMFSIKAT